MLKTFLLLALTALCGIPATSYAQTPTDIASYHESEIEPRAGEIQLSGTIASVGDDELILTAESFTNSAGKTAKLAAPKPKTVRLAGAAIWTRGDPLWRLRAADLKTGFTATIVGRDNGSGQPLPARALRVVRLDAGQPVDYFVAKNGSPAYDGSAERPWETIGDADSIINEAEAQRPRVLHLGAGKWAPQALNSMGDPITQLRLESARFVTITGAGAREGGTQITSGDGPKESWGTLLLNNCRDIRFCNLTIGDDRAFEDKDAFFEATVYLRGQTDVSFEAVEILGPSRQTTLEAGSRRSPTAIRCYSAETRANLDNVLVRGHGTFLSNPQGRVACRNVTFAQMFGVGLDDNFLFLQTPKGGQLNEARYTFRDCVFYELARENYGSRVLLSSGAEAEDKAAWLPPSVADGGNYVVRARFETDGVYYQPKQLPLLFGGRREKAADFTLAHGIWENDDTRQKPTGALEIWNELPLADRDGFALVSSIPSGWRGGFAGAWNKN